MSVVLSSLRDLREFVESRKRSRVPIRFLARGVVQAEAVIQRRSQFTRLLQELRPNRDFGPAQEKVDALAHALKLRHGCELPTPRKIMQNSDRSLTLFWTDVSVRAFRDGIVSILFGQKGRMARGMTTELLDVLEFHERLERMRIS